MGGAVAQLCTLRLLRALHSQPPASELRCIVFGAPPIGNAALASHVQRLGWGPHFTSIALPGGPCCPALPACAALVPALSLPAACNGGPLVAHAGQALLGPVPLSACRGSGAAPPPASGLQPAGAAAAATTGASIRRGRRTGSPAQRMGARGGRGEGCRAGLATHQRQHCRSFARQPARRGHQHATGSHGNVEARSRCSSGAGAAPAACCWRRGKDRCTRRPGW